MAPRDVLEHRRCNAFTPLKADAWERMLRATGLLSKYPSLPSHLRFGFSAGIPRIHHTYTPSNKPMPPTLQAAFTNVVSLEFERGRYVGPFTRRQLEEAIGPFQSSPISMCPKPHKPDKFRLVQNFSHPHSPMRNTSSINSYLDSDLYPCTWGTFTTVCTIIHSLPPGSQAAVRDVAEAYRTIPLAPDQWPGTVVRLGEDLFAADSCMPFGLSPAGGIYGGLADAGKDLFLANGIGPLSKWVDDHLFFRIRRQHLHQYNHTRSEWAAVIRANGGPIHDGGRLWYKGSTGDDGRLEQFDEDMSFPLQDLSSTSPRSDEDSSFTYCLSDIDKFSTILGYPWEPTKDIPFCTRPTFLGFLWDLETLTVSLAPAKAARYLEAITVWQAKVTHTLEEVQKLYGKLLHASLIRPAGRAYLTRLEEMLGIFHDRPFMPRTPPKGISGDLEWWKGELLKSCLARPIPGGPCIVHDLNAYSDASSGFGIGIIIGEQWRAWRLRPGWKKDGRDIGWAEAVGFLFLVITVLPSCSQGATYKVYGDNIGVVEGWWTGRSRNRQTNNIFRLVHAFSDASGSTFVTRYIPSKANPADKPSRGIYPPVRYLLPPIPIPFELQPFVANYDDDPTSVYETNRHAHDLSPTRPSTNPGTHPDPTCPYSRQTIPGSSLPGGTRHKVYHWQLK